MDKLIGLQRAEFQRAERLDFFARMSQLLTVFLSIISLFIQDSHIVVYILSILSVVAALVWLYYSEQSKHSHTTAEKGRRAVLLIKGLGIKLQPKFYTDLHILFKVKEEEAKKWEDQNYFKSNRDCGYQKLAEMLEESAFWTKHLLKEYTKQTWCYFGVLILMCLLSLLLTQFIKIEQSGIIISQMVCIILIWLATGSIFSKALTLTSSAQEISFIEDKLNSIVTSQQDPENTIVYMSDYNAIVENIPIIPTKIYKKNKDRLNQLWKERNSKA
ncbi:TPA: hypothetical protein JAZ42_15530 [Legionella pneumophila]|nr:hypothetical protein [Legionella pneumophila]HAT1924545.1 hypothetical protein [Legionella pneumophila]HAT7770424.1 hypothetical protein [Legionella pneumophila]HAU1685253.1 hypothetical protein [Legionella pneumophila]HAU1718749.1 hypothetical protein [Legionella pneumophila]